MKVPSSLQKAGYLSPLFSWQENVSGSGQRAKTQRITYHKNCQVGFHETCHYKGYHNLYDIPVCNSTEVEYDNKQIEKELYIPATHFPLNHD